MELSADPWEAGMWSRAGGSARRGVRAGETPATAARSSDTKAQPRGYSAARVGSGHLQGRARRPAGERAPRCLQACSAREWSHLTASLLNSLLPSRCPGRPGNSHRGLFCSQGRGRGVNYPPSFCAEDGGLPWTLGWGQPGHLCKFLGTMTPLHRLGTAGQDGPPAKPPRTLAERLLCAGTQGCFTRVPWGPGAPPVGPRHWETWKLSQVPAGVGHPPPTGAETLTSPLSGQPCPVFLQPQPSLTPTPPSHWKLIGHSPGRGDPLPLSRVDVQAQSCRGHLVPGPSQRPGPTSPPGGAAGASLFPARRPQWPSPPARWQMLLLGPPETAGRQPLPLLPMAMSLWP